MTWWEAWATRLPQDQREAVEEFIASADGFGFRWGYPYE